MERHMSWLDGTMGSPRIRQIYVQLHYSGRVHCAIQISMRHKDRKLSCRKAETLPKNGFGMALKGLKLPMRLTALCQQIRKHSQLGEIKLNILLAPR